jgi:hypothetical protein
VQSETPKRPIRLIVSDDLGRSRLTVFFRLILAIPHLILVSLWGLAAYLLAIVVWFAILIQGRAPRALHSFIASYVRYLTHVTAYVYLAANPYPRFSGSTAYPVDVEIDPPAPQRRLGAAFRLVLAIPVLVLSSAIAGAPTPTVGSVGGLSFLAGGGGALCIAAFLGWFASIARGRMPRGLRDLGTYAIGYGAQTAGYVLLLTDRYPNSDPALVEPPQELPAHPVRIRVDDPLARSRLTVFFRLLLAIPHIVWLLLWGVLVAFAVVIAWLTALVIGRMPRPFHRFIAAWIRYSAHVNAFLFLVGGPFPGFVGAEGSYPVDLTIDRPMPQRRLVTLFRFFLALPAFLVSTALTGVLYVVALLGWWAALVRGRMPEGLRNLGAACVRYNAQATAYAYLVTERYPHAGPALRDRPYDDEHALVPVGAVPPELSAGALAEPEPD